MVVNWLGVVVGAVCVVVGAVLFLVRGPWAKATRVVQRGALGKVGAQMATNATPKTMGRLAVGLALIGILIVLLSIFYHHVR